MLSSIKLLPFFNKYLFTNFLVFYYRLLVEFPATVMAFVQTAHLTILIRLALVIGTTVCCLVVILSRVLCHGWWCSFCRLTGRHLLLRNLVTIFNWTILNGWL